MQNLCFLKCLSCDEPPVAYANPLKHHKLCEFHLKILKKSTETCKICSATVKIHKSKPISCEICGIQEDTKLLECGHSLCSNCLFDDNCSLCLTVCMNCRRECFVSSLTCQHKLCEECISIMKTDCDHCNFNCLICHKSASIGKQHCSKCEQPCFTCKSERTQKIMTDCKVYVCATCSTDNLCIGCSKHTCSNCFSTCCKKGSHQICISCQKLNMKCIKCYKNQKCSKCLKNKSTFPCDKSTHSLCAGCVTDNNGRKLCPICQYLCCACGIKMEINEINQNKCGHDICNQCLNRSVEDSCKICPKKREFYTCEGCKIEFRDDDFKYEIKNCDYCKARICTGCGKKVSYFSILKPHQCSLGP